jgi:hypothetical protein
MSCVLMPCLEQSHFAYQRHDIYVTVYYAIGFPQIEHTKINQIRPASNLVHKSRFLESFLLSLCWMHDGPSLCGGAEVIYMRVA